MDETFDIEKTNSYHLSLLKDENSFSIAVLDPGPNKYIAVRSGLTVPLPETDLLKHDYRSVSCSVAHPKFALVPSVLFDEENKDSLLGFNHEVKEDEIILSGKLHNLEAKNIFTVSKKLVADIRALFPKAEFLHSATPFIEGLLVRNKNRTEKKVFANFYPDYFEVAIPEGRELLFSNAFRYKTPEDIAYYILFLYEQLHLDPETTELVLSGEIEKTDTEHSLLYTYIRNVRFASRPDGFNYSYKFGEFPSHKFFSLFNQYLCA